MSFDMLTPLTLKQRSCLLRASRARLAQLHEDYEALRDHGDIGNGVEALLAEINCISSAIAWLWVQPVTD
jgi:hypothetical protein